MPSRALCLLQGPSGAAGSVTFGEDSAGASKFSTRPCPRPCPCPRPPRPPPSHAAPAAVARGAAVQKRGASCRLRVEDATPARWQPAEASEPRQHHDCDVFSRSRRAGATWRRARSSRRWPGHHLAPHHCGADSAHRLPWLQRRHVNRGPDQGAATGAARDPHSHGEWGIAAESARASTARRGG